MKKFKLITIALALTVIFSGCGTVAKTSQEFRKTANSSAFGTKESFVVNRSYSKVVNLFQKNSKRCLNKTFKTRDYYRDNKFSRTTTDTITYSTKFKRGSTHSKMDVSLKSNGIKTSMFYQEIPKDGLFIVAVDITKKGANQTQIDIYRPVAVFGPNKNIVNAIKAWANGTSKGCPNLRP